MILPLGLGHKHIKTSFISWFVIISFGLSFIYKKDINISIAEIVLVTLLVLSMAPYVEMRMGRLLTFLFSMTIGVASGKLVLNEPNYVNFFAVASWYSGAYFSLFYLRDFKWAIWKVWGWKYFSVSSGLVVPFLYVFAWWGYVFSSHSPDYIHNFLPISSFLFGLFTGHVYRRKNPIPLGFLYQFEWNRWKSLSKRNVNTKKMVSVAKVILDFNPMNIKVQYDICKKIVLDLKNEPINENQLIVFFNKEFNKLLIHLAKENRIDSGIELINSLNVRNSFVNIFIKLSSHNLLLYGSYCEKKHFYFSAIILYTAFIEKNPKSNRVAGILKKIDFLIEHEFESQQNMEDLAFIEMTVNNDKVKTLFKQHFQFSRTAVVTAVRKKTS